MFSGLSECVPFLFWFKRRFAEGFLELLGFRLLRIFCEFRVFRGFLVLGLVGD